MAKSIKRAKNMVQRAKNEPQNKKGLSKGTPEMDKNGIFLEDD